MDAVATNLYRPGHLDEETFEKVETLGVAAATAILAAEEATGKAAHALYAEADAKIDALCEIVQRSLEDDPGDE